MTSRLMVELRALGPVRRAGMIGGGSPAQLLAIGRAMRRYGSLGGAIAIAGIKHGDRPGLIDELGTLTFGELDRRSNALANAWRAEGIVEGTSVGILCRNHRGLLDALFATAKLGCRALFLNTDFAAPQAREVCAREGVQALVYDEEFAPVVADVPAPAGRFLAWTDGPPGDAKTLESVIAYGDPGPPPAPGQAGALVVLTSGTTGTPKGAQRPQPRGLAIPAAVLSKVPYRSGGATYIAPPIFHGLGLLNTALSVGLGSTVVTQRRFDPAAVLAGIAEHRCSGLVVVPIMLRRVLDLDPEALAAHDTSPLRIILTGGAQLGAPLAERARAAFGDVVHNFYGSTEVAFATIATPEDLRAEPGCVGRPPLGVTVEVIDDAGRPVPAGTPGRIFVGNPNQSNGYTGGGSKQVVRGLMATGDVGHFDAAGRLFVDGRDDDMIVSGGENVFPGEVTDLLTGHPAVLDAAVVGVPDEEFGQSLRAFVVRRPGHELDEAEVKAYVKDNLARYKSPRTVVFTESLPRNPSGKILTRQLLES